MTPSVGSPWAGACDASPRNPPDRPRVAGGRSPARGGGGGGGVAHDKVAQHRHLKDVFSDTALRIGGILVYLRYTLTHAPLLSGFLEILKQ